MEDGNSEPAVLIEEAEERLSVSERLKLITERKKVKKGNEEAEATQAPNRTLMSIADKIAKMQGRGSAAAPHLPPVERSESSSKAGGGIAERIAELQAGAGDGAAAPPGSSPSAPDRSGSGTVPRRATVVSGAGRTDGSIATRMQKLDGGDDTDIAAAPIGDDTAKSDDPEPPHDGAAAVQDAALSSSAMSASVVGDRSQADGDDTDIAAAPIADDTAKSDDPKAPHDGAAAVQDTALSSPAMSASVVGDRSQADGDDTDTAAAPIADDTAKSDDPKAPHDGAAAQGAAPPSPAMSARSARDGAVGAHALGDAVTVVGGDGRRMHEGIVRFVGVTRFVSHA